MSAFSSARRAALAFAAVVVLAAPAHAKDIALLNVGPAAGSGLDVARRLRELNLPFVVIGTYSHDILSAELRDAPYLSKPCTADQIVGALAEQLQARRTPLEEPPRYRPFSGRHEH